MPPTTLDLAIIGAGPIGVEAALYARRLGLSAVVLEQAAPGATAMHACGRTRMFSPWWQTCSPLGIDLLRAQGGFAPPVAEAGWDGYLRGYVDRLVERAGLDVRYRTRVVGIGRAEIPRTLLIGANRRTFPFRLLLQGAEGREEILLARHVIDASGVRDTPLYIGEGRLPAINERALRARILPGACDLAARVDGDVQRDWLVIGDGFEAATAVHQIRAFIEAGPAARLVFIDEQGRQPWIKNLKDDLFPERVEWLRQANDFLDSGHARVAIHTETTIQRIDVEASGFRVGLRGPKGDYSLRVDHLVGATGFMADDTLWRELQIHQCYASGAPMATAAAMLDATLDFRHVPYALGGDSLKNPEPGFYVLGSRSYGRNPGFSLHVGLGQIVAAFRDIAGDPALDLYATVTDSPIPSGVVYLRPDAAPTPIPEARLTDSEQRYKTIADNLREVVFQTDLKQFITYLSPSWRTLTGKDPDTFIGLHWQDLLAGDTRERGLDACNAFMSGRMADYREELMIERVDGAARWVEVRAHALLDRNGVAYGTIGSMVDITERVRAQAELERKNRLLDELTVTDALTGIHNRRHFDRELEREIKRAQRDGLALTLAIADIDHFKDYNDAYGHQLGDLALKRVAEALRELCQRDTDLVARYGGEEFVVLLPGTDRARAAVFLEHMRIVVARLGIEHRTAPDSGHITLSIGAATLQDCPSAPTVSPEIFMKRADDALYESKRQGRNRVTFCVHESWCTPPAC